jgi:hypothetical protein
LDLRLYNPVSILGGDGGIHAYFENPLFFRGRGKILHRERRKWINKCKKFSLLDKNTPPTFFSNPGVDTDYLFFLILSDCTIILSISPCFYTGI